MRLELITSLYLSLFVNIIIMNDTSKNEVIEQTKQSDSIKIIFLKHPFLYWLGLSILVFIVSSEYGPLVSIITFFIAFYINSKNKEEEKLQNKLFLINEANEYIDLIKKTKSLSLIKPEGSIFLDKDENLFLKEDSILKETRSVRHSSGGFGGVTVMKGVRIGGYSGTSSSSLEWSALDRGTLFLTSQKLLFTGNKENRTIKLENVVAIKTYLDAIEIKINGRSKAIQFPVKNPYIWSTAINILKSVNDPMNIGNLKLDIELK